MRKKSELSELNERPVFILSIIVITVFLSLLILIISKFYISNTDTIKPDSQTIRIASDNFPTIQLGHYALWGEKSDSSAILIKRFNSIDNQLKNLDGSDLKELEIQNLDSLSAIFVTIENEGDRDEIPNNLVFMKSQIIDNTAELSFEVNFDDSDNSFVLSSPTDGNTTINEKSGLWFKTANSDVSSLQLPVAKENFIYEARIQNVINNKPLILGKFQKVTEEDNSRIYSLGMEGYKYPGEDFLTNLPDPFDPPLNLANGEYTVIVSIEPYFNEIDITGEDVFLELMRATIPANLESALDYPLESTYKPITLTVQIDD